MKGAQSFQMIPACSEGGKPLPQMDAEIRGPIEDPTGAPNQQEAVGTELRWGQVPELSSLQAGVPFPSEPLSSGFYGASRIHP